MAEWEAAVLDAQMDRLDAQNAKRSGSAALLTERIGEFACVHMPRDDGRITADSHYLFQMRLALDELSAPRDAFVEALNAEGVPCSAGYRPLHRMGMLRGEAFVKATGRTCSFDAAALPRTDLLCDAAVWIPGRVLLAADADMHRVADAIAKVVVAFRR
ncbi:MAG: hypothetical protein GX592_12670, partial [Clostridiales bacterium]|nr:hypothetical protein [Clostridiales bacterium]